MEASQQDQQQAAQQAWDNYKNGNISFHDLRTQLDSLDASAVADAPGTPDQVPDTPADVPPAQQPPAGPSTPDTPADAAVPLAPDDPARVPSPADTPAAPPATDPAPAPDVPAQDTTPAQPAEPSSQEATYLAWQEGRITDHDAIGALLAFSADEDPAFIAEEKQNAEAQQ